MKYGRELPTRRPIPVRVLDWKEVYEDFPPGEGAHAGRALHGLRHPVLPHRLPAREPHPRVERPRVPRPTGRPRASGCTRPTTSPSSPAGCARRRAKRRACSASTSRRSRSSRSRSRSSTARGKRAGSCRSSPTSKTGKRVAVVGIGPGRARGRAAAHARRPRRHGLRARRPHRRPAALRHPRVQDGEAPPRPARRADGRRGHRVPRRTRTSATNVPVARARRLRRGGARGRRDGVARPAGSRAASSPASTRRWSTCRRRTACRRATSTSRRSARRASTS